MNILLSNIIEFNVAINIHCNVLVPRAAWSIMWGPQGKASGAPKSRVSRNGTPKWAWFLTGLFLQEKQKAQQTDVVLSGSGQVLQPFSQFTFGGTEAWGIGGSRKASFDL